MPPVAGDPLGGGLAYVKQASALRQAAAWNSMLDPRSPLRVAVGERRDDGRWPLVWTEA